MDIILIKERKTLSNYIKEVKVMALSNLAGWNEKTASSACGSSCGSSDKPEVKPTSCGSACGADDK